MTARLAVVDDDPGFTEYLGTLLRASGYAVDEFHSGSALLAGLRAGLTPNVVLLDVLMPDIDGIDGFQGEIFHSARWNHDVDLRGKRVAVIGTGASSIQIVPEVAKVAAHLDVYQRTAPYVIPRGDRPYTRLEKLAFRHLPLVQRAYRTGIYWGREALVPGFTVNPRLAAPAKRLALANIRKGIDDPELRAKVTPDYQIGCKRILISNEWYPALARDNVELVTDGCAPRPSGRDGLVGDVEGAVDDVEALGELLLGDAERRVGVDRVVRAERVQPVLAEELLDRLHLVARRRGRADRGRTDRRPQRRAAERAPMIVARAATPPRCPT